MLVVARTATDLDRALAAGHGHSLAFDGRFLAGLERLGPHALTRSVGDVQRLLNRDPASGDALSRIRWVRSLGLLTATARVGSNGLRVEFRLPSDRLRLTRADLPLEPGARSPSLPAGRHPAAAAVRGLDRLARFLERSLAATDPESYSRYATAIGQLRSLFGVDLHRDLIQQVREASVAFGGGDTLALVGRLRPGSAAAVGRTLERAQPALDLGAGGLLPGARVESRAGVGGRTYVAARGRLELGRFGLRSGALVASVGSRPLPVPAAGQRPRGVSGSLVLSGDLGRMGSLLGLIVELPRQGLRLVSGLGDLVLGVRTDTAGMIGRGRLSVLGRSRAGR